MSEQAFNPNSHMMKLKGKDYLPVAARVLWFREEFPIAAGWGIRTRRIDGSFKEGFAEYYAEVVDPEGRIVATGSNVEDKAGFGDFLQKAETGAIGRALAAAGFGTMAALDEGPDNVVDSPVERPRFRDVARPEEQPMGYPCEVCNAEVDYQTAGASRRAFNGRVFCITHGREMKEGMKAQGAAACKECGQIVTEKVANASVQALGFIRCADCQKRIKAQEKEAKERFEERVASDFDARHGAKDEVGA